MKNFITQGIAASLLLVSSIAQAVPTLFFDGDISYDAQTRLLSVNSILTDTFDIVPQPDLTGSLNFDAQYISEFIGFGFVTGTFGSVAGQDDITVLDANMNSLNMNSLLTGNFNNLLMSGNAGDFGSSITGEFVANGGTLEALFGVGNVIALQFNLDVALNNNTFNQNFNAHIDGRVEGTPTVNVPEPSILALLGLGFLIAGFARSYSIKS